MLKEKPPLQTVKTRTLKSQKTSIFSRGIIHGLGQKLASFPSFYFRQNGVKIRVSVYIRKKKTPSQATKTRSLKTRKIDIFPKGLSMVLVKKWPFFPTFFLGNIGQKKIFYDILARKNAFLGYKNKKTSKSRKIDIFPKALTHGFGPKMVNFPNFFLSQYRPGKCLLRYSSTKKRPSRL